MVLCNKDCIPCCDFCLYSIHEKILIDGKVTNGAPVGCFKHPDIEHQKKQKQIALILSEENAQLLFASTGGKSEPTPTTSGR